MTTLANTPTTTAGNRPAVGEPHELGRYTLPDGTTRQLIAQRIDRHVRVVDVPADDHGRHYVIERELEQDGYGALIAIVTDYLAQAAKHGNTPLAVNPIDRYLEHLSA